MVYRLEETNYFRSSKDKFGCFGNMCGGFPLTLPDGKVIHGSEILYQWFKYKGHADIQKTLLEFKNPLKAKWYQKKYKNCIRSDWDDINIDVMKLCCLLKWCEHTDRLYHLREEIIENGLPVVEVSKKDNFWGCVPNKDDNNIVEGENVLGQIWDEILRFKISRNIFDYYHDDDIKKNVMLMEELATI
ncbi:MAG: NADAR family protein [Prevotellaceae bacterium]|jgi:ribA/ribD-fused uncharacterized protein|nr:NADAR family protein [Prevotellaceae bacterium]